MADSNAKKASAGFEIDGIIGLSEEGAVSRRNVEGYNELPSSKPRSIFQIAFEVIKEPMFLLLVAGGVIYFLLGDIEEAIMLLGFVFVVMGITLYQESKTERALEALRDLSSPRALVLRDGEQKRIAGREVVRGDVIFISEGDRVPADVVIVKCTNLSIDESLLTGESVPVRKTSGNGLEDMGKPGGDDLPFAYSGTLVTQGQGIAIVKSTGMRTEIGKIGKALQSVEQEETKLQKDTGKLVRNLALLGLSLCSIVVVSYGLTRGNTLQSWIQGLLAGITMAMAVLPEEFPVVLTIFLALGAWRMSQKKVLTRRIPAIETLGSATVLCTDKTGTLTQNRMTVRKIFANGNFHDVNESKERLPDEFHEVAEFSILASHRDPFDPMEKAFKKFGDEHLADTEHLHPGWTLLQQYPLSKELLAMSHVWKSPDGRDYVIAAKGAPEAIADLCHFDDMEKKILLEHISQMADEGLRVLGIARAKFSESESELPEIQHDFDFEFLGLIGLEDPVRPGVPEAIMECKNAGVRVVMITGDYPGTARAIASQIGLDLNGGIITGPNMELMGEEELRERIKTAHVFARVVPEQKLRIVNALKSNGEIVAMTGDGVNDAPALKSANIGIAMGGRGTDVAREASSLVLLDDHFASIVQAIRQGRRIFDNLKKAMSYILAVHVPIAGMSLLPVLLGWPLVLLPVHVVFLELIIDPACSIVFEVEQEEKDIMNRLPRDPKKPLFGKRTIGISILQGASVLAVVFAVFATGLLRGLGEAEARALAFTTLIVANIALILANRSWSRTIVSTLKVRNPALWWVVGGAAAFLAAVLCIPTLRSTFKFASLSIIDAAICIAAGILSIVWFEVLKKINKGTPAKEPQNGN
ncbi:MAG: cation-translocating P-type ATPase [Candidatus Thermoplasmatota archaeon]|nr:cation-translocating P-type ATPase [Candidatus Thermoplasmatota archaeon]